MKKKLLGIFCALISAAAFCEETETDENGIVSIKNDAYIFNILFVADLEQTEVLEDLPVDEELPLIAASKAAKVNEPVSLYLGFASLEETDSVDLSYDLKVQKPDGTFLPQNYKRMVIAKEKVKTNVFKRGNQTWTMVFDSGDDAGKYQFYVDIYDGQKMIDECVMSVNLVK